MVKHHWYRLSGKAFDSVPHEELLYKLWSIGITGPLWRGFHAYLHNRQHLLTLKVSLLPQWQSDLGYLREVFWVHFCGELWRALVCRRHQGVQANQRNFRHWPCAGRSILYWSMVRKVENQPKCQQMHPHPFFSSWLWFFPQLPNRRLSNHYSSYLQRPRHYCNVPHWVDLTTLEGSVAIVRKHIMMLTWNKMAARQSSGVTSCASCLMAELQEKPSHQKNMPSVSPAARSL